MAPHDRQHYDRIAWYRNPQNWISFQWYTLGSAVRNPLTLFWSRYRKVCSTLVSTAYFPIFSIADFRSRTAWLTSELFELNDLTERYGRDVKRQRSPWGSPKSQLSGMVLLFFTFYRQKRRNFLLTVTLADFSIPFSSEQLVNLCHCPIYLYHVCNLRIFARE